MAKKRIRIIIKIAGFLIISLFANALVFGMLTVRGYLYIYNFAVEANTKLINISDGDYEDYVFFDGLLNRNMAFLLEDVSGNFDFYFDFFMYLSRKTGIKYVADGVGYAAGRLIDAYIQTGDEAILDSVFSAAPDIDIYGEARRGYYKKLCEYNLSLPDNERIDFFGIGAEQSGGAHSILYIKYLLGKETRIIPAKIGDALRGDMTDAGKYLSVLRESLKQYEPLYKEVFVGDYFDFSRAVENYFYDINDSAAARKAEAVNFARIYEKNIRGKYFLCFDDASFAKNLGELSEKAAARLAVIQTERGTGYKTGTGTEKIYAVNGGGLSLFGKHYEFLYRLAGEEPPADIRVRDGAYFLILNTK